MVIMIAANIKIRPARNEDIESLTGLLEELFTIEADFSPDTSRQSAGLRLLLQKRDAVILVAESGGKVVGMCTIQVVISTAEGGLSGVLEDMIVARDARRQGIGRALLQAAESWAEERGLTRLQLLAESENEAALAFYFKMGWQGTGLVCRRKFLSGPRHS
jgi:ribosomal protein S18 acetylase RimI-like enzyme